MNVYGHVFPQVEEALTDRLDVVGRGARPTPDAVVRPLPGVLPAADLAREWHDDTETSTGTS